jgi:hypothetical protein
MSASPRSILAATGAGLASFEVAHAISPDPGIDREAACLAHRHADLLVEGVGLEQAAALARGVRADVERA